ncbi:MAG: nitroreductase family protein [Planctomycetota bacterium]|nr:nitroreductase family protein [Planctomycetota bacterium]
MNETIALMKRHRSIRRYTQDPVPEKDIRAAVEAGQAASTSAAVQAYCLIRVTDAEHRVKLAEFCGNQSKVARSGAFFIVCGDARRHRLLARRDGHAYDARLEGFLLAVIDASLFAQNLALAFEAQGYGICYIGGLRNSLPEVDALLGLPEGVYPLFGLCVGVPDEDPARRPRLPVEAVLFEEGYPSDEAILALMDDYDGAYRTYLEQRGAEPKAWTATMAGKFARPRRDDIAAYYRGKGADLT